MPEKPHALLQVSAVVISGAKPNGFLAVAVREHQILAMDGAMRKRLTLDPSSFGKLMEAAWVLQQEYERRLREDRPSERDTQVESQDIVPQFVEMAFQDEPDQTVEVIPAPQTVIVATVKEGVYPRRFAFQFELPRMKATFEQHARRCQQFLMASQDVQLGLRSLAKFGSRSWVMLLLITSGFMALDLHYGHQHILAAPPKMSQGFGQASNTLPEPPAPASHKQITDDDVSTVVDELSPYEIRNLTLQAQYGDADAALVIGMAYETGRHVHQNCQRAAQWVERSAQDGNAAAQYNLALRYQSGDGVAANPAEGEKWMRQAVNQNYPGATADVVAMETAP